MQRIIQRLQHKWRIRMVMTMMMIIAITLTSVTFTTVNWFDAKTLLLNAATSKAEMTSQITEQKVQQIIDPAEAMLRVLAFDPVVEASTLPQRLRRLEAFTTNLYANPLLTAVYIGYDNGDYFLVSPLTKATLRQSYHAPEQAKYVVRTLLGQAGEKRTHQLLFYDQHLNLIEQRIDPDYVYDPRQRPWYNNALATTDVAISKPYIYADAPLMGVTLSMRSSNSRAIVAMDLPLNGIKDALQQLSITPHSQIALVDSHGELIGVNMGSAIDQATSTTPAPALQHLENTALLQLWQLPSQTQVMTYQADDQQWLGRKIELAQYRELGLQLLVAIPSQELLKDLPVYRRQMIGIAIVLGMLLLALGAWLGHRIGQIIEQHIRRVRQMSHFDFSRPSPEFSLLYEAYQLTDVTDDVSRTMEALLKISQVLQAEPQIDTMLNKVLRLFVEAARCESGAVYLHQSKDNSWQKNAAYGRQDQVDAVAAQLGNIENQQPNRHALCQAFAIRGRDGHILGYVILEHKGDHEHTSQNFLIFSERLTGMLAIPIETRQLIESQKALLEAFILVLADAIDTKSAHTGGPLSSCAQTGNDDCGSLVSRNTRAIC